MSGELYVNEVFSLDHYCMDSCLKLPRRVPVVLQVQLKHLAKSQYTVGYISEGMADLLSL
jgi:hypothetical protein